MEEFKINGEGLKEKTQHLTDHVGDLFESYYRLGVLNVTEKTSNIASLTVTMMVVAFLSMFTLFFLGIGLGWWIGEKLNNMLAGFSIVAGIFMLIIVVILAFKKQLLSPFIRNIIIKKVYE